MVAAIRLEWWPRSGWNGGRDGVGIPGRLALESAVMGHPCRPWRGMAHGEQPENGDRRDQGTMRSTGESRQQRRSSPSEGQDPAEPFWIFTSGIRPIEVWPARSREREAALLAFDPPVFKPCHNGDGFVRPARMVGTAPRADLDRRVSLTQPPNRCHEGPMDHCLDFGHRDRQGGSRPLDVVACRGVIDLYRSRRR